MNVKQKLTSAKNFVQRNERRILVTALAATSAIALIQNNGIKNLNQFLEDNDLADTYYHMDEEV